MFCYRHYFLYLSVSISIAKLQISRHIMYSSHSYSRRKWFTIAIIIDIRFKRILLKPTLNRRNLKVRNPVQYGDINLDSFETSYWAKIISGQQSTFYVLINIC